MHKPQAASDQADAARHADIKNGWQVRTDHFLVTTNHSLAAGAELAARLERLYQVWRQLFAGFYYTEKEVRGLFAGERNARVQTRPFRVFYYRNRDEYVNALRRRQPRIAETLGIYFDATREAHFFAEDDDDRRQHVSAGEPLSPRCTMKRSISSSRNRSRPPSRLARWRIFGSLKASPRISKRSPNMMDPQAGLYFTIGEATAGRLPAARERLRRGLLHSAGRIDAARARTTFNAIRRLRNCTASRRAWRRFLLDGEQGRYREPLVRYLQAVYAGRDNDGTLARCNRNQLQ